MIHRVQATCIIRQTSEHITRIAHRRSTQLANAAQKHLLTRRTHVVVTSYHLPVRSNSHGTVRNRKRQRHRRIPVRGLLRNESAVIVHLGLLQTREVAESVNNLLANTRQTRIIQTLTRQTHRSVLVVHQARLIQGHRICQSRKSDTLQVGRRSGHQRTHQKIKVVLNMREPSDIRHRITEGPIIKVQAIRAKNPLKFTAVKPQSVRTRTNTPLTVFLHQLEILSLSLRLRESTRQTLTVHRSSLLETHVVSAL